MSRNVLHTIQANMGNFSKGQKRIAAFILENYDKAAFMTASRLGKAVSASESTVVRFATALGFDGYPNMQRDLQEMIRTKLTSIQRIQASGERFQNGDVLETVMQADVNKLHQAIERADREEFDRAVDKLLRAKHIYILGARSSTFLAGYMNFYFRNLFDNVVLIQDSSAGSILEQLMRIGPGDVIIGITFPRYSNSTATAIQFAHDRGAEVIAITDSELSPLCRYACAAIMVQCEMISFVDSMVAPLSMINALIVAVGHRKNKDLSLNFTKLERIWEDYGVFERIDHE